MFRGIPMVFVALFAAFTSAALASAQLTSTKIGSPVQVSSSKSPVAFVYVSSNPSNNKREINAFAAASNGKLTAVQGSPFSADVQYMAVNRKYLFGTNGIYIYSFSMAPDGGIKQVGSINAQQFNGYNCGGPASLFLDHTGATLYDEDFYGNLCANSTYQFFTIDRSTGELNYLGATAATSVRFEVPLSFTGNNVYAYGSTCYHLEASIFGFKRNHDSTLTQVNSNPRIPDANKGDFYCSYLATADLTNHVAISLQPYSAQSWQPDGPAQLATYTADSFGTLTTNSTFSNMPRTMVKYVTDIRMSPSGKLLAVGGTAGLQVFHFNGSKPITHYGGRLTQYEVDQMFWDNDNHLYAISQSANKLFVFTITPTSCSQAPGSPYTITNPQNIIVLPKT